MTASAVNKDASEAVRRWFMVWPLSGWLCAALLAATLGYFVFAIPVQLFDCFRIMTTLSEQSLGQGTTQAFSPHDAYYRPLLWVESKAVFDLSRGHYHAWYRAVQVGQIVALLALFVRLLRVQTANDAIAAAFALAVLVGIHTFNGTVREAFPVNHFMMVLVACLAAANLITSRGGPLTDAAVVALFVFATLNVESGLLVWVVVAAGYVVGLRGVSIRAVCAVTALTVAYLVARIAIMDVPSPPFGTHAIGFGFRMLEADEVSARFSGHRLAFGAYNVMVNLASLLFAEPRAGVFVSLRSVVAGEVAEWRVVNVAASALATALIGWYTARRVCQWRAGLALSFADRLTFVAFAVFVANAVLGYGYSKDLIMSPAFYAFAAYAAVRELLGVLTAPGLRARIVVAGACYLFALGSLWSIRVVGLHVNLSEQAIRVREDWATADQDYRDEGLSARARSLKRALQDDAIMRRLPSELTVLHRLRWFDQDY